VFCITSHSASKFSQIKSMQHSCRLIGVSYILVYWLYYPLSPKTKVTQICLSINMQGRTDTKMSTITHTNLKSK
jgi:hypothetical protein